jgi:hypothetical protein
MIYGVSNYHGDEAEIRKDSEHFDVVKHEAERAKDGFSEYDWWSFDTYIAEVIARAALKFVQEGHGYFGEMGEEGTKEYFLGIAGPLMAWAQGKFELDPVEGPRVLTEARAAMHRFVDYFERWWD